MSEGLNVLSLFDGMSCGQLTLQKAGVGVKNYYASEIDKHAMAVTKKNFPNTQFMGNVTKWREWDIDWWNIGLLIGGSPCQGFSFAGKQLNFDDPRSKLFFVFVDILNHIKSLNPDVKFLLENVVMKKEYEQIISDHLLCEPMKINSALVSAQNRKRLYWTNVQGAQMPEDKSIMLGSILQEGITDRDKSHCIDASYWKGTNINQYFKTSRRQIVFLESSALVPEATKLGYTEVKINECVDLTFIKSKTRRGRLMREKSNCLTASNYDFYQLVFDEQDKCYFRKLTPVECERLQNVPDNYTEGVSNSQRYKMLGNGWTIDVIVHILKGIIDNNKEIENIKQYIQTDLFTNN